MNKYLVKLAQLSSDTKKEVAQTGVMAAAGGATGYAGHKLMQTNAIKRMKIPEGGKAAIAIGGLGLLGDYSAVKLNRHIEKKAYTMENKYLEKIASQFTEEQAEDMSHPKRLWLTGAFAHRKAINDAGGEASVFDLANRNRMAMYSKDAMKDDLKRHAKVSGTTAAIGAIIGAIAAHSKGKSILGAGVGALVGAGVGSMGTSNYNLFKKDWGERIPAQVKEDILAGKYDKK